MREARVRYRDAGGAEVASVTVGQADLAFATLSRGSAPGAFGKTGGTTQRHGPENQCVADMAFDPDDLLYAAGGGIKAPIQPFMEFSPDGVLVARYNEDGGLDSAFAGNGKLRVDTSLPVPDGADEDEAPTVVADGANAIVASGFSVFVGGHVIVENSPIAGETNRFWALSKLDINGNEDLQFGDGLTVIPENTEGGRINDLALGQSSRVMAAGSIETNDLGRAAIAAINSTTGEVDNSFGFRIATFPGDGMASSYTSVAVDSQNRVYAAGWFGPPQLLDPDDPQLEDRTWFVVRFQENGIIDDTFSPEGTPGVAEIIFAGFERAFPSAIAIDDEDRIITVGSVSEGDGITSTAAMARLLPDGSLDDDFQDGGRFVNDAGLGGLTAARMSPSTAASGLSCR